jgi:hypothetical protein
VIPLTSLGNIFVYFLLHERKNRVIAMETQFRASSKSESNPLLTVHGDHDHSGPNADDERSRSRPKDLLLRILKNPLFLVLFTWTLMAFLLAFEISGK